jgi:hypothetical protein
VPAVTFDVLILKVAIDPSLTELLLALIAIEAVNGATASPVPKYGDSS